MDGIGGINKMRSSLPLSVPLQIADFILITWPSKSEAISGDRYPDIRIVILEGLTTAASLLTGRLFPKMGVKFGVIYFCIGIMCVFVEKVEKQTRLFD